MRIEGNNLYADNGKWLYRGDGAERQFWKSVTLARPENQMYYRECTEQEYEDWQEEYNPQPEPPQPEPEPEGGEV